MKKTLLAAAAILSLSTAAMAEPVKLSSGQLGDVAGGHVLPSIMTNLALSQTEVYAANVLSNQDSATAIGLWSGSVGAGTTSALTGVNTIGIGGGM